MAGISPVNTNQLEINPADYINASATAQTKTGALILGTDPGGSELLRVGGDIRAGTLIYCGGVGSGSGGNIRHLTDSAVQKWATGILGSPGASSWSVYDLVNSAERVSVNGTSGAVIIGTDPGGSELLRVGGGARINGAATILSDTTIDKTGGNLQVNIRADDASQAEFKFANRSGDGLSIFRPAGSTNLEFYAQASSSVLTLTNSALSSGQASILYTTDGATTTIAALVVAGGIGWGDSKTSYGGGLLLVSPTIGLGYTTGAGGEVTQATSKSTGVTLDTVCGKITMNAASLGAVSTVSFTLTNSTIAENDLVIVNIKSGATVNSYDTHVESVSNGECVISLRNHTAGALAQAVVLSFAVIKAVEA